MPSCVLLPGHPDAGGLTCSWEEVLFPPEKFSQWDIESWSNAIPITCTDIRHMVEQVVGNMNHCGKIPAALPASEQELASVLLRQVNIRRMQSLFFLAVIHSTEIQSRVSITSTI